MRYAFVYCLSLATAAFGADQPIPQDAAKMEKHRRDWLEWNRRTLAGAYDKVGVKDPRWDEAARETLELAARMFSKQVDPVLSFKDIAKPARAAIDAGCRDPLIVFLHARTLSLEGGDETRRYKEAARAFADSRYPAWRRAAALTISIPGEQRAGYGGVSYRREVRAAYDRALALLPESVATDDRNEFWELMTFQTLLSVLRTYRWLGMDGPEALEKVDAELAKCPELKGLRLYFRGNAWFHFGWEARTVAFAPQVPEGGFQKFEERLAIARKALEEAWEIRPDSETAAKMMEIDRGVGGDREVMERWFERAMKADGDNRDACWAKLEWLDPKWYGTPEEMLAFGRACRDSKNWHAGITLLCADAHWRFAVLPGVDQLKYLRRPEVWADIHSVYEEYLKHHPEDDVARCKYATFSYLGAHYREAEVQYVALGDRLAPWKEFPYLPYPVLKRYRDDNIRMVIGGAGGIEKQGWHFVAGKHDDGDWHISVPVHANRHEEPGILGADGCTVFRCSDGGVTYHLRIVELPPALRKEDPGRVLDEVRSVVAKEQGARPGKPRETLLAARPAQEYDVEAPGLKPKRLRVRTIILGEWLFELSVTATEDDLAGENVREFFESFAFQPKSKPPAGAGEK